VSETFILDGGEPLAVALQDARRAARKTDVPWMEADAAYRAVLHLVTEDARLWAVLAAEHVSVLRSRGALTPASSLCEKYLRDERALTSPQRQPLLIERAQVRSQSGAHAAAVADVAEVRAMADRDPMALLDRADLAGLRRVEGLAAAAAGDHDRAERCLEEARAVFRDVGDSAAASTVDAVLRLLAARQGSEAAVAEILSEAEPLEAMSVPRALAYALALKRRLRYEAALQAIVTVLMAEDLDEALRPPVLEELVALLVLLRRDRALKALRTELRPLVGHGGPVEGIGPPAQPFHRTLLTVFELLGRGEARQALVSLEAVQEAAASDRDRAHWHLACGEAWIAAFKSRRDKTCLNEAVRHLTTASEYAVAEWLLEIKIRALRCSGEAFELLKKPGLASDRWAQAHALEERLVARQQTDKIRAGLLEDMPSEHDERIRVAAERAMTAPGAAPAAAAVAGAIAAMESARGAAILGQVAPDAEDSLRGLPAPGDDEAAWKWLRGIADSTARDEAIWIMHARPGRVHHGVIGRNLVRHLDVPADRGELEGLVKELRKHCNEYRLRQAEGRAQVSELMERLAAGIGVETVLAHMPKRVKRLVVVAGGVLSDIPLAALPMRSGVDHATDHTYDNDKSVPIVCRFAVSDLPCISARPLLRQRAVSGRGARALQVSAFEDVRSRGRKALDRIRHRKVLALTTLDEFEQQLRLADYRLVRILGHGQSDPEDASHTWLQFAHPESVRDGRMRPGRFQDLRLGGCGTLILGACESGMAQRVGRDERTGFVRAGLHAGAASVVAARWIAEVSVTAALLDRFEGYLRYLPRDVALRRAQLDVRDRRVRLGADVPEPDHPAWWACWTLYGDSGHQVRAYVVRAPARRSALRIRRLFRIVPTD
jgi:hypothetical protein